MSLNAKTVPQDFDQFDATLSLENPVMEYEKLVNEKLRVDAIVGNEMMRNIWNRISIGAGNAVWRMLFDTKNSTKDQMEKAATLLKKYRDDACFYSPWIYNDWIVTVRDELLKRQMMDFWKNIIVAEELGPAWARDCDLFEDIEDPEPANFYKFAGCEAPWLNEEQNELNDLLDSTVEAKSGNSSLTLKRISKETPLEDYKANMDALNNIASNDKVIYNAIFAEARDIIWQLLFSKPTLSVDNSKMAGDLLVEYKRDACFYSPYDYNSWILNVREEILKRKYFDFWENIIVQKDLGLCWVKGSEYFDDIDDPEQNLFYETGEELMKKLKNK